MIEGRCLSLAVEDRFVVLRLREDGAMLPGPDTLALIADTMRSLSDKYSLICDLRSLEDEPDAITYDVQDAVQELHDQGAHVMLHPTQTHYAEEMLGKDARALYVRKGDIPLEYSPLDLSPFDHESNDQFLWLVEALHGVDEERFALFHSYEAYKDRCEMYPEYQDEFPDYHSYLDFARDDEDGSMRRALDSAQAQIEQAILSKGKNSLLTEFAVQVTGDSCLVTPYHAHALHSVATDSELMIGRPGIIANKTSALFQSEIAEFQRILADPDIGETTIQKYLESHPNMLRVLGYSHIYPQVVLSREDGSSLRPDFILEPIGHEWCDILDIKTPRMQTVVGGRDRKTLSAYIHELAAQLREYAAYFEDERLAKRVQELYGIKCYRPRLIGIIGQDPRLVDERQQQRLMTMYNDIRVVTFDELLRIAQSRLLI